MRPMLIALATIIAACASGGRAGGDPAPASDHEGLRACLARGGDDESQLRDCKGVVVSACLDEWEVATQTIAMCWTGELNAWRAAMEEALARTEASDPEHRTQLGDAQGAWTEWVATECEYRAAIFGGGTGTVGARIRCAAGLTADRAVSLMLQ